MKTSLPVWVFFVCVAWSASDCSLGQAGPAPAPCPWKSGDQWDLLVRQYGRGWALDFSDPKMKERAQFPGVALEFAVRVRVAAFETIDGKRCARFEFTPGDDALDYVKNGQYALCIDCTTRRVVQLEHTQEGRHHREREFEGAGDQRALFTQLYCVPVDWIIEQADLTTPADKSVVLRENEIEKAEFVRSAKAAQDTGLVTVNVRVTSSARATPHEVEQVWAPGEGWWRSFKRYEHGHLDLEAVRLEHACAEAGATGESATGTATDSPGALFPEWAGAGAKWNVKVKQYVLPARERQVRNETRVEDEFCMTVSVLNPRVKKCPKRQVVQFRFTPSPSSPLGGAGNECILEVASQSGQVERLRTTESDTSMLGRLNAWPGQRCVFCDSRGFPGYGFPVDWVIRASDLAGIPNAEDKELLQEQGKPDVTRCRTRAVLDGREAVRIEASWEIGNLKGKVVQVWVPGEPWWRSFRRYSGETLVMEAVRVDSDCADCAAPAATTTAPDATANGQ